MKTILTLFFALSLLTVAKAQTNANVIVTDCSGPAMCDGAAEVQPALLNTYTTFDWYFNQVWFYSGTATFQDLCVGNYILIASGSGVTNSFTFTIGASSNDPCLGYQIYSTYSNATSQQSCDGQLFLNNMNGTGPYTTHWERWTEATQWTSWTDSASSVSLTQLNNLCMGEYIVNSVDAMGCVDTAHFFIWQNEIGNCTNPGYTINITPTSCSTCLDGGVEISPAGGNSIYYYALDTTMSLSFTSNLWTLDGSFSNLPTGPYLVYVTDTYNCWDTISIYVPDATTSPCNNFTTNVIVTDCTLASLCNGAVQVNTTGVVGPYDYTMYQGLLNQPVSSSQNSITNNLCAGYYTLIVNDTQGCESITSVYVDGTIDSISVFGTASTGAYSAFSSWIENCDIDLTALDTTYIASAVFGTSGPAVDSLYVVWYLADTTGLFTNISYTYFVESFLGVSNLILNVYCPVKSNPIYYQIISPFDLSTAGLSSSSYVHPFRLFPNPATNLVTIVSPFERNEVEIFNIAGILVYKGISMAKSQDLPLNLPKGTYIICVSSEEQLRYTEKLVIQ